MDSLAPGSWRAVTCRRGGRIAGYLPYVERRERGMSICEMPQITRFLGPVVTPPSGKTEARFRSTYAVIAELLEQLESYDHVEMTLNTEFDDLAPFLAARYDVKVHPTFLLDCRVPIDDLWAGLRDKTKNVIRRAREQLIVKEVDDPVLFADFYRKNLEGIEPNFDLSLLQPAFAASSARDRCRIVAAVDSIGDVHAQVFFIWDDKYVYYFLSTRDRGVAHLGAVSLLLWSGIEFANAQQLHFDFDGGIDDGARYKFKVAFGGRLANRFDVSRSSARYQLHQAVRKIPRVIARRISAHG